MKLRDLGRGASSTGSERPTAPPSPGQRDSGGLANYKWAVIEPAYCPQESVLLVIDPACLAEAKAENPGLVTYLLSEAQMLAPLKDNHEFMLGVHRIKKILGGRVREVTVPQQGGQFKPSIDSKGIPEVQR